MSKAKPLVYVETTVVSYLTARRNRDRIVAAHQEVRWLRTTGGARPAPAAAFAAPGAAACPPAVRPIQDGSRNVVASFDREATAGRPELPVHHSSSGGRHIVALHLVVPRLRVETAPHPYAVVQLAQSTGAAVARVLSFE